MRCKALTRLSELWKALLWLHIICEKSYEVRKSLRLHELSEDVSQLWSEVVRLHGVSKMLSDDIYLLQRSARTIVDDR